MQDVLFFNGAKRALFYAFRTHDIFHFNFRIGLKIKQCSYLGMKRCDSFSHVTENHLRYIFFPSLRSLVKKTSPLGDFPSHNMRRENHLLSTLDTKYLFRPALKNGGQGYFLPSMIFFHGFFKRVFLTGFFLTELAPSSFF
jgi:hypothetical protein